MAKNEKRVSISKTDTIMKERFGNTTTEQWYDAEVKIKHSISFTEMLTFVNDVVMSCFQKDGGFMPEVLDFAIKSNILTKYANFSMPDNLEHRYEIIYNTDAVDFVCRYINMAQLNEIVASVNRKLDYMCNSNVAAIQRQLNKVVESFEDVQQQTAKLFDDISSEDIAKITNAISSGELSGDKIVEAYLNHTKPAGADMEVNT